ncbi:MAG: DUF87 domain-containing protein, partial [Planctomycetes bacterium]|nr:DUF87 domain-containing protein [Planctomycetota bacterium]
MGPVLQYVLELIRRYHLDDRSGEVRNFLRFAERRPVSESIARAFLYRIQDLVTEQERRPNLLHRMPAFEEIYPHGPPEIVIGKCSENEDVPVGLSLAHACHLAIGGTTGFGKTVGMRRLIYAVAKYNRNHDRPIIVIILDRKLDYADLPEIFGPGWVHYDAHGALRIGLQTPLGVPPDVWIGQLATIFCARSGLIASWATMVNMIRWAIAVMNPKPDDRLLFPDFQLLLDLAEYLPNVYCTATVVRPASKLKPWEPARAYGATTLLVDSSEHRLTVNI